MAAGLDSVSRPDPERVKNYDRLYQNYLALGSFVEAELGRKSTIIAATESSRAQS